MRYAFVIVLFVFVGLPLIISAVIAAKLFVYEPLMHRWDVRQMNVENQREWANVIAQVATVEIDIITPDGPEKITTDVACHERHIAHPVTLKGPRGTGTRFWPAADPTQSLSLANGEMVIFDLRAVCPAIFLDAVKEVPHDLTQSEVWVFDPQRNEVCEIVSDGFANHLYTVIGETKVRRPHIVSLREAPLRDIVPQDALMSSALGDYHMHVAKKLGFKVRTVEKCWLPTSQN